MLQVRPLTVPQFSPCAMLKEKAVSAALRYTVIAGGRLRKDIWRWHRNMQLCYMLRPCAIFTGELAGTAER